LSSYRSGIHVSNCGGPVTLQDNDVFDSGRNGILVAECEYPVMMSGNNIERSGLHGVTVYRARALIRGGRIGASQESGLWLRLASRSVCQGVHFLDNSLRLPGARSDINAELSPDLLVTDNKFDGTSHRFGFELDLAGRWLAVTFRGNTVNGSREGPSLSSFSTRN
jgi:hypothetical protein